MDAVPAEMNRRREGPEGVCSIVPPFLTCPASIGGMVSRNLVNLQDFQIQEHPIENRRPNRW